MVNPRLPAHFNHISQPIEKYKLLSMHFWVARRHAAELPVEPVTFRVRSFLFRINWLPRCGSDVRPCTAVQLLGEVTIHVMPVARRAWR